MVIITTTQTSLKSGIISPMVVVAAVVVEFTRRLIQMDATIITTTMATEAASAKLISIVSSLDYVDLDFCQKMSTSLIYFLNNIFQQQVSFVLWKKRTSFSQTNALSSPPRTTTAEGMTLITRKSLYSVCCCR